MGAPGGGCYSGGAGDVGAEAPPLEPAANQRTMVEWLATAEGLAGWVLLEEDGGVAFSAGVDDGMKLTDRRGVGQGATMEVDGEGEGAMKMGRGEAGKKGKGKAKMKQPSHVQVRFPIRS